jgi:translation elongation factor EF-1beta
MKCLIVLKKKKKTIEMALSNTEKIAFGLVKIKLLLLLLFFREIKE